MSSTEPQRETDTDKSAARALPFWRRGLLLFLFSFLALFVELVLIRWTPSTIHVLAFFNNLVLIGCFLGLGVGMARPVALAEGVWQVFFRLGVLVPAFVVFNLLDVGIAHLDYDYGLNESFGKSLALPLPIVLLVGFGCVVWVIEPLGRLVGTWFDTMERLPAYSINVAGSLVGVVAFAAVSYLQWPPIFWFLLVVGLLLLVDRQWRHVLPTLMIVFGLGLAYCQDWAISSRWPGTIGSAIGEVVRLAFTDPEQLREAVAWSPYYKAVKVDLVAGAPERGFFLQVNNQFLLSGLDLRTEEAPAGVAEGTQANIRLLPSYYNFPFRMRPAKRVLILGAGAGNDVAAALRHGAEKIVAVEIDPVVLAFGSKYHPEKPYQSDKVHAVLNDARAYLNTTAEEFDLIVFATLDAHGLISKVGNVRLDSFIYTRDSFLAAKRLLASRRPDGAFVWAVPRGNPVAPVRDRAERFRAKPSLFRTCERAPNHCCRRDRPTVGLEGTGNSKRWQVGSR